jgi:hypothetical protein
VRRQWSRPHRTVALGAKGTPGRGERRGCHSRPGKQRGPGMRSISGQGATGQSHTHGQLELLKAPPGHWEKGRA